MAELLLGLVFVYYEIASWITSPAPWENKNKKLLKLENEMKEKTGINVICRGERNTYLDACESIQITVKTRDYYCDKNNKDPIKDTDQLDLFYTRTETIDESLNFIHSNLTKEYCETLQDKINKEYLLIKNINNGKYKLHHSCLNFPTIVYYGSRYTPRKFECRPMTGNPQITFF